MKNKIVFKSQKDFVKWVTVSNMFAKSRIMPMVALKQFNSLKANQRTNIKKAFEEYDQKRRIKIPKGEIDSAWTISVMVDALLDKGIPILMTNFSRILNTLTGIYSDDRNQFIDSFNKYSLLIIDDLGIERSSEFALEQVFNVIDSRYRSKKPLIVTTNLTLDELKHPKDLARARIYDRVLERCVPLKINNQNIRELNAAANMQEARKILNSGT